MRQTIVGVWEKQPTVLPFIFLWENSLTVKTDFLEIHFYQQKN